MISMNRIIDTMNHIQRTLMVYDMEPMFSFEDGTIETVHYAKLLKDAGMPTIQWGKDGYYMYKGWHPVFDSNDEVSGYKINGRFVAGKSLSIMSVRMALLDR